MSVEYQNIINLLKGLSDCQKTRLVKCILHDAGLEMCLGKQRKSALLGVKNIDSIISGGAGEFCNEIRNSREFASTLKSIIYRIIAPEDLMIDFLDFRMENWPEE